VDDVRNVVQDDDAFRDIYVARVRGEQRKKESVSSSMIVDFDMDRIQNDLRSFLKPGENIRLDEVDMDYLDAFMATLFLAQRGEVSVFQEDFGKPIFLVS
jgi:chromatin segregation and condensation protein Rec8/ScpA/Scc1 (kleisin family)